MTHNILPTKKVIREVSGVEIKGLPTALCKEEPAQPLAVGG